MEHEDYEQGAILKLHVDDATIHRQTIVDNLRTQTVLASRVFYMDIVTQPGMDSLHEIVVIQSWIHLFDTKSLILHEEELGEIYYNIEFQEDGSIKKRVGNIEIYLVKTYWETS